MRIAQSLSAALLIAAACGATAEAQEQMKPGQWEYSTRMEMPGMPMALPPTVVQHCLKAEDVAAYRNFQPENPGACEMRNLKTSGNTVTYDMECKGEHAVSGRYEFTTTASSMQGSGTMQMQGQQMTMKLSARRLGDCK
jgi:hypothetical protein